MSGPDEYIADLENELDDLHVENESLRAEVEFYKEQAAAAEAAVDAAYQNGFSDGRCEV